MVRFSSWLRISEIHPQSPHGSTHLSLSLSRSFSFVKIVVASIVLKGVLAHLAPLPMERRRELFPSENLSTVLALLLKNKAVLQAHSGPFGESLYKGCLCLFLGSALFPIPNLEIGR